MAYEKHTWTTGEVITAGKLNNMEDGIASAGGVIAVHDNDGTLDKTWQEIHDALSAGVPCFYKDTEDKSGSKPLTSFASVVPILFVALDNGYYLVVVSSWMGDPNEQLTFSATRPSDYPRKAAQ